MESRPARSTAGLASFPALSDSPQVSSIHTPAISPGFLPPASCLPTVHQHCHALIGLSIHTFCLLLPCLPVYHPLPCPCRLVPRIFSFRFAQRSFLLGFFLPSSSFLLPLSLLLCSFLVCPLLLPPLLLILANPPLSTLRPILYLASCIFHLSCCMLTSHHTPLCLLYLAARATHGTPLVSTFDVQSNKTEQQPPPFATSLAHRQPPQTKDRFNPQISI